MSHKAQKYNHVAIQHQYIPMDRAEENSEHVNNFKKATEDSVMFKDMDKSYMGLSARKPVIGGLQTTKAMGAF